MFVSETVRLERGFGVAGRRLADLSLGGSLLSASQAAYGDGANGLARVGPPGAWLVSKLVRIHVGEPLTSQDAARFPLRWEATGPGSALFPALDADIVLASEGERAASLTLTGVYRPPLGSLGAMLDRALLSRIATATIRDFLDRLARAIEDSTAEGEQDTADHD